MRYEFSLTRHVKKSSLHPIFVNAQFVQVVIIFSFFCIHQCSLITSKDLSKLALSASALTETSRASGRLSESWISSFHEFFS